MRMFDIINKKKNGGTLFDSEIEFFIHGIIKGEIPDYQISALLMAICIRGMSLAETTSLTMHMAYSGDILNLDEFGTSSCDKHSTGGTGDKTTLIVAPIVASCGGIVAKMSGKGLGYTGGTVDKLEAIPGFKCSMTNDDFLSQVRKINIALASQGNNLAPADKILYAIRDVTATVDSIPLIASSIMSKKIASGSHSIVLDIKCGSGAFMKSVEDAEKLANLMISIGKMCGKNIRALVTNMNEPLGYTVGNIIEVKEAVNLLNGGFYSEDLYDICIALSAHMISMYSQLSFNEAKHKAENAVKTGAAFEKFLEWISSQGGNLKVISSANALQPSNILEINAPHDGYIESIDAYSTGKASVMLGAGRTQKNEKIDPFAGIKFFKKSGDHVSNGEKIAVLYSSSKSKIDDAVPIINRAIKINKNYIGAKQLIIKTVL